MSSCELPRRIWAPIGLAVLTCFGYIQTDRQAQYTYTCSTHVIHSVEAYSVGGGGYGGSATMDKFLNIRP